MPRISNIAGYRVLSHVGSGAASELFAVQDPKTKQVWALKHVHKQTDRDQRFIEQVEVEFSVGAKLDHANIRAVEKIHRKRKRFKTTDVYLVMELVDAMTLDGRLPESQRIAVNIFHHIALGLTHMHDQGFVHADMKPSNVLVMHDGDVKIIDLGQACPVGTVKKRIQGTPGYMAPEQAHRQPITPKTDMYNFGATMYWVLIQEVIPTALPPKDESGSLYSGALDAEMVDPPVPPIEKNPAIHPLLSKQIMDCVQMHPDARPESMEKIAARLEMIGELLDNPPDTPVGDLNEETHY